MASANEMYTSTGFGPVDDEHEALSLALAAFVEKVNSGKVDEVRQSLEGVIRGVAAHFAHEEGGWWGTPTGGEGGSRRPTPSSWPTCASSRRS